MADHKQMQREFTYNLSDNELFRKDDQNYINALGIDQLKRIGNVFLLDVFLSDGNCVEFHYHPNATELVYCVSGEAEVGFLHLDTKEWQTFLIKRGEVVTIPQGWWHIVCAKTDHTHLLAIHDTNQLETVFGSDILRKTPKNLLADVYCLNEGEIENALQPIQNTVVIGPPENCRRDGNRQQMIQMRDREQQTEIPAEVRGEMEQTRRGSMDYHNPIALQVVEPSHFAMDQMNPPDRAISPFSGHMYPMYVCPNCFGMC